MEEVEKTAGLFSEKEEEKGREGDRINDEKANE